MPSDSQRSTSLTDAQVSFIRGFITDLPASHLKDGGAMNSPANAANIVTLQKARLVYAKTLQSISAQLKTLEAEIIRFFKDEPRVQNVANSARKVYLTLASVDTKLVDCLDDALNASTPEDRLKHQEAAVALIDGYLKQVNSNPVIAIIDDNPIYPVSVQSSLLKVLTGLRTQLG